MRGDCVQINPIDRCRLLVHISGSSAHDQNALLGAMVVMLNSIAANYVFGVPGSQQCQAQT